MSDDTSLHTQMFTVRIGARRVAALTVIAALAATCGRPRYVVTAQPIDIGLGSGRFCVAVDPSQPHSIWWWEPGLSSSDCSQRSTGPSVFHIEDGSVLPTAGRDAMEIRFRLGVIRDPGSTGPSFADIRLVLDHGAMRAPATAASVRTTRRRNLDIPGPH